MDALQAIASVKTEVNISVYSRHSEGCDNERNFLNCSCPKWAEYYIGGKQKKLSLKSRDREVALGKAREMGNSFARAARGEVQPPPVATGKTVEEAVEMLLASKRDSGLSLKHVALLKSHMEDMSTSLLAQGVLHIAAARLEHLEKFRSSWDMTGRANSRRKRQQEMSGFFKYCDAHDWVAKNIVKGMSVIKRDDPKPTLPLTDDQFSQLVAAVPSVNGQTTDLERSKLRALLMLQRWSGLAIKDAVTLERKRLQKDPDNGGWYKLLLRRAKTGVPVYCAINPSVASELLALPGKRYFFETTLPAPKSAGMDDLIKNKWSKLVDRLDKAAQLVDEHGDPLHFHSHMLRDTFAVWCFQQGLSTEDVAALLGHANITITQQHYNPWIQDRAKRLGDRVKAAYNTYSAAIATK